MCFDNGAARISLLLAHKSEVSLKTTIAARERAFESLIDETLDLFLLSVIFLNKFSRT